MSDIESNASGDRELTAEPAQPNRGGDIAGEGRRTTPPDLNTTLGYRVETVVALEGQRSDPADWEGDRDPPVLEMESDAGRRGQNVTL